ncbi:MAG: choice-of-anchor J domain-containing protein, partial [Bacteroidota bacterium]
AYIAFYYTSSGTGGGETSRVRIDNVAITNTQASTGVALPYSEDFQSSCDGEDGGLPGDWVVFSSASTGDWACNDTMLPEGTIGAYVAQANNFGEDEAAEDWFITPGFALASGNNAFLTFDYSTEFTDAEGFGLEVRASTDYSGSGDPASATWTALDAGIVNSNNSNEFLQSVSSLSSLSGTVYIAFYYTSSGVGGGETSRVRIDNIVVSE